MWGPRGNAHAMRDDGTMGVFNARDGLRVIVSKTISIAALTTTTTATTTAATTTNTKQQPTNNKQQRQPPFRHLGHAGDEYRADSVFVTWVWWSPAPSRPGEGVWGGVPPIVNT